jgi:mono/diheme cytochrome c family protein
MSNETIFFIFGIALAVSAVLVSFAGLKLQDFPGKAMPLVVLWFAILVGGATTFAVLHAKDEDKVHAAEYGQAGKEIEKAESSGPFESGSSAEEPSEESGEESEKEIEEEETGAEGKGGTEKETESPAEETAAAEAGAQVFASAGCSSCHVFNAANSTGTVGPDLSESLASDDTKAGIEEMIVDPNAEIVEGYSANVMPGNFGESLTPEELRDLIDFLYDNSAAGEGK